MNDLGKNTKKTSPLHQKSLHVFESLSGHVRKLAVTQAGDSSRARRWFSPGNSISLATKN